MVRYTWKTDLIDRISGKIRFRLLDLFQALHFIPWSVVSCWKLGFNFNNPCSPLSSCNRTIRYFVDDAKWTLCICCTFSGSTKYCNNCGKNESSFSVNGVSGVSGKLMLMRFVSQFIVAFKTPLYFVSKLIVVSCSPCCSIRSNNTLAVARVAWPHRAISFAGVNHRNVKLYSLCLGFDLFHEWDTNAVSLKFISAPIFAFTSSAMSSCKKKLFERNCKNGEWMRPYIKGK